MAVTATLLGAGHNGGAISFAFVDFATTAPAGSLIVFIAQWADSTGVTPTTVAESVPSAGLTWTQDFHPADNTVFDGHMGIAVYSAPAPSGMTSTRIGITFGSNLSWGCSVTALYLAGVDLGSSRVDGTPTVTFAGGGSGTAWSSGPVTTAIDSGVLAAVWADGSIGSSATDAPATELVDHPDAVNDWIQATSFLTPSSAGAQTVTGNYNSGPTFGRQAAMIAYKAAGGAATTYTLAAHNVSPLRA